MDDMHIHFCLFLSVFYFANGLYLFVLYGS